MNNNVNNNVNNDVNNDVNEPMKKATENAAGIDNNLIYNILIVDDVPKNIQVVANILQQEGFRMAFAQDGNSALHLTETNTFDLILLDIMMPGLDGFEVCERLKEDPNTREIPVIFLTARTDTEDIVKAFGKGAVDYVMKPFNAAELLARVKTHLELKAARQQLAANNDELIELNATKDKFFSIIAHDLRNPIQGLLLASEMLKTNYHRMDTDKITDYIHRFHKGTNHISDLLENLLTWSRAQRGKVKCIPVKTDIQRLTAQCIDLLAQQAEKKNISLTSNIPTESFVFADPDMIRTVIRNLISNAVKFTPQGGSITVSTATEGNSINTTICDTGVGIEEDDLKNLFRIDNQKTTTGTSGEKGTGLGLLLCKEFIEKNQGTLHAESTPGKGSTFTFSLKTA